MFKLGNSEVDRLIERPKVILAHLLKSSGSIRYKLSIASITPLNAACASESVSPNNWLGDGNT